MSQESQHYRNVKLGILNKKKQYHDRHKIQIYSRVEALKQTNNQLQEKIQNQQLSLNLNFKRQMKSTITKYKKQQTQLQQRIIDLEQMLEQYRKLCSGILNYTSVPLPTVQLQPFREKSRYNNIKSIQIDQKQNDNRSSRSCSVKKIRTSIFCHYCNRDMKPQQYYRHPCAQKTINSIRS